MARLAGCSPSPLLWSMGQLAGCPPPLPSGSEGRGGGERGRWEGRLVEREYSCPSPLPIVITRAGKIWSPTPLPLSSVTLPLPLSPTKVWRPLGPLECVPGSPVMGRIHQSYKEYKAKSPRLPSADIYPRKQEQELQLTYRQHGKLSAECRQFYVRGTQ